MSLMFLHLKDQLPQEIIKGGTAPEQVKAAADRALKLVKSQS